MNIQELAQAFSSLFRGLDRAYGTYRITNTSSIKQTGAAVTKKEPVTLELWEKHLVGQSSLGIIPINDEALCVWGCIDVDEYANFDIADLSMRLKDMPFIVCRSKSGGAHIFVFLTVPMNARDLQGKLRSLAAALGFGGSEVFPKQIQLMTKDDIGQWLNMPYFDHTKTTRYGLRNGERLSALDFLAYVETKKISPQELMAYEPPVLIDPNNPVVDGPPCLQILTRLGYPSGSRNNGLYNVGVYYKKVNDDNWEALLRAYNDRYMRPPLTDQEVGSVIKSLKRKNYTYKCHDQPICNHCDRPTCRTRKYGIGTTAPFTISAMNIIQTEPRLHYFTIDETRVGPLRSVDFSTQDRLRTSALEYGVVLSDMRRGDYQVMLKNAIDEAHMVEVPQYSSVEARVTLAMMTLFSNGFSIHRASVMKNIPYLNGERIYFHTDAIMVLLTRRYERIGPEEVVNVLRQKCKAEKFEVNGVMEDVWSMPKDKLPKFDAPTINLEDIPL